MTSLVTPLAQLAPAFDVIKYKARLNPKKGAVAPHPLLDKVFIGEPVSSSEIAELAKDRMQLWQYLTGLYRVLPWYASNAFATNWEGEATANGISLATRVIHAIAPLPEVHFFHTLAALYRPAEEGGLDFTAAGSARQSAEELDGDWYSTISAFVADLIRYRALGVDGRTHSAGGRLHALGVAVIKDRNPRRKTFGDQEVIDTVHSLLLGEQTITAPAKEKRVAQAA